MQIRQDVFVACYVSSVFSSDEAREWPIACRRFTPSQKALVAAAENMQQQFGSVWQAAITDPSCHFAHASVYGEVDAIAVVAEKILSRDYLVSPIAFQNSVANATVAALCRFLGVEKPYTTHVGDWLVLDEILEQHWFRHSTSEAAGASVVLHCEEYAGGYEGRADLMVLANEQWLASVESFPTVHLSQFVPLRALAPEVARALRARVRCEEIPHGQCKAPWLNHDAVKGPAIRIVRDRVGRELGGVFGVEGRSLG